MKFSDVMNGINGLMELVEKKNGSKESLSKLRHCKTVVKEVCLDEYDRRNRHS